MPPIPIKIHDGEDTKAQREFRKFKFELHGNVIHKMFVFETQIEWCQNQQSLTNG